jgi:hypothetical protein
MPIIVVNLANLPINSATSNAGFEYSVHNAISPKHFYIHDTVPGTLYDIRVRWTFENPAYESDISTVAMMVGGTAISLLGLVLAPFTAGLSIQGGALVYQAIAGASAVGLAIAKGAVPLTIALAADATKWIITDQKVKDADDIKWTNIKGAETTILVIKGHVPFQEIKKINVEGKEEVVEIRSPHPNQYPLEAERLEESTFNSLRSKGELTQSRIPALADLNILLGTLDNGAYTCALDSNVTVATNRRYWIENHHPGHAPGILGAHDAETDMHFYRTPKATTKSAPESQWQLVPHLNLRPNQGGNRTGHPLNVFALFERRWGKCLAYDGNSVQMRGPLSLVNVEHQGDKYHFGVDFTETTWEAEPKPHPVLKLRERTMHTQDLLRTQGWTPFFALIPGSQPGYFYITPFTPATSFTESLTPELYTRLREKGPFISADDGDTTRIWTLEGHPSAAMSQWRFEAVDI